MAKYKNEDWEIKFDADSETEPLYIVQRKISDDLSVLFGFRVRIDIKRRNRDNIFKLRIKVPIQTTEQQLGQIKDAIVTSLGTYDVPTVDPYTPYEPPSTPGIDVSIGPWEQHNSQFWLHPWDGQSLQIAQTFTAAHTGAISKIVIAWGGLYAWGNIRFRITAVDGQTGFPTGPDLDSVETGNDHLDGPEEIIMHGTTHVVPGQKYAIIMENLNPSGQMLLYCYQTDPDHYTGGKCLVFQSGNWQTLAAVPPEYFWSGFDANAPYHDLTIDTYIS